MKKYIQFLVVLVLVFAVVGLAKNSPAWASKNETVEKAPSIKFQNIASTSSEPSEITITESGTYNIRGICNFEVTYNLESGLKDIVDIDVPTDFSTDIPFGYEGDLYLPGCHILHYKDNELVRNVTTEDGSWKVCFAERPNIILTIYYYHEEPFTNSQVWIELETSHEDGFACASAIYSGEYTPGTKFDAEFPPESETRFVDVEGDGTVRPPPSRASISESGTYAVGGICTFIVLYREPFQTNEIHVADALRHDDDPIDDYDYFGHNEFSEEDGFLHYPGCHVLHYDSGDVTHWEKDVDQGEWIICFAEIPDKETTIWYYIGDTEEQESGWFPLPTTIKNGEACAPAFFTAVYTPAGK